MNFSQAKVAWKTLYDKEMWNREKHRVTNDWGFMRSADAWFMERLLLEELFPTIREAMEGK